MRDDAIEIFRATTGAQASLLKVILAEKGIEAWIYGDAEDMRIGETSGGWTASPRVLVAATDAAEAREIAEEFDRSVSDRSASDDEQADIPTTVWRDWPTCRKCRERRRARCPMCGSVSIDFPLALDPAGGDGSQVLLICPVCDDHFRPEYYRYCERCDHDFGDGIETDSDTGSASRTITLFAALLGICALIGGYFWWLMRS